MHGLMDALKNARSVVNQSTTTLIPLQYPLLECMPNFLDVSKGKNQEIQVW
jgi:hypothetical protein